MAFLVTVSIPTLQSNLSPYSVLTSRLVYSVLHLYTSEESQDRYLSQLQSTEPLFAGQVRPSSSRTLSCFCRKPKELSCFASLDTNCPPPQEFVCNSFRYHAVECIIKASCMSYSEFVANHILKATVNNRSEHLASLSCQTQFEATVRDQVAKFEAHSKASRGLDIRHTARNTLKPSYGVRRYII